MYYVRFDESGNQLAWCKAEHRRPGLVYYEAPGAFVPELYKCSLIDGIVTYKFVEKVPVSIPPVMENEIKREFGLTIIDEFGGENTQLVKAGVIQASDIGVMIQFFTSVQMSIMGGALTTAAAQISQFYHDNPNYLWLTEDRKNKYVNMINTFLGEL